MVASPVDEFETTCPNCRKDFDVLATDTEARCPHCHVLVKLVEPQPAAAPYVPPAPRAPAPAAVVDDTGRRDRAAEKAAQAAAKEARRREAQAAKAAADEARRAAAEQAKARKAEEARVRAEAKARAAEAKAQADAQRAAAKAAAAQAKAKADAERAAAKAKAKAREAGAESRPSGWARLNFLTRRERTPANAREAVPILDLEGVGPVFAAKLEKAGIRTSDDLLAADADELARRTRIGKTGIRKWQDMADLVHVNGIGPQFAEVLVRCDINSVAELARQEPRPLAQRIQALLDSKQVTIVGTGVTEKRTKAWIAEARKLAPPPPSPGEEALKRVQGEDRAPQNPLLTETGLVEAIQFRGKAFRVECERCEEAFLVADNVRRGKCPYCGVAQALRPVVPLPPDDAKPEDPKSLADDARHEAQRGFLARFSRREVADVPPAPRAVRDAPARKPLFSLRRADDPEARQRQEAERKAAADAKAQAKAEAAARKEEQRRAAAEAKAKADAERAAAKQAQAEAAAAKPAKPAKAKGQDAAEAAGARFSLFPGKALETVSCAQCGHRFTVRASQRKATCPSCHSRLGLVPDDGSPLPAAAAAAAPTVAASRGKPAVVKEPKAKGKPAGEAAPARTVAPLPAAEADGKRERQLAKEKAKADAKAAKAKAKEERRKAKADAKAAKAQARAEAKAAKAKAKAEAKAAKAAQKDAKAAEALPEAPDVPAAKGRKGKGAKSTVAPAEASAEEPATQDKAAAKLAAKEAKAKEKAEAKAAKLAAKEAKAKAKADAKAARAAAKEAKRAEAKDAAAPEGKTPPQGKEGAKPRFAFLHRGAKADGAEPATKGKGPTNAEGDAYTAPVAGQAVPVIDLEGVGPTFAKKLEAQGVRTSDDLLAADAQALSKSTRIDVALLRKWQDMCDLIHIDGIGPQFAEVLVRSGVNSVAELARQEPKPLAQRIQELVDAKKATIVGVTITDKRTKAWIKAARKVKPRALPGAEPAPDDKKAAKLAAKEAKAKAKAEAKAAKLAQKEAKAKADAKPAQEAEELSPRQLAKLEKQRAKEEERRKRALAQLEAEKARLAGAEDAGLWAQAVARPLSQQHKEGVWAQSVEGRREAAAQAASKAERKEALSGKVRLVDGRSLFSRLPEDKKERTPPRLPDGRSPFTRIEEDEAKHTPKPRLPDGRSPFERLPEDTAADYDRLHVFGHKPGKAYTTKAGFHITEEILATEAPAQIELGTARDRRRLKRQAKQDDKTRREEERKARKEAKEARKLRLKEEREAAVKRREARFEDGAGKPGLFGLGRKAPASKEEVEPAQVEVKKAKAAPVEAARVRQVTEVEPAPQEGKKPRFTLLGRRKDVPEEPREVPAEAKAEAQPKRGLLKRKAAEARTDAEATDDVAELGFFERRRKAAAEKDAAKQAAKEAARQAKADAKAQKAAEKEAARAAKELAAKQATPAKPETPRKEGKVKRAGDDAERKPLFAFLRKGKDPTQRKSKAGAEPKPGKAGKAATPKAARAGKEADAGGTEAKPRLAFAARRQAFLEAQAAKRAEREKAREAKAREREAAKAAKAQEKAQREAAKAEAKAREDAEKARAKADEERRKAAEEKARVKAEAAQARRRAADEKAEARRRAAEEKAAAKARATQEARKAEEAERARREKEEREAAKAAARAEAARRKEEERARFAAERAAAAQERERRKEEARLAKLAAKGKPEASQPTPLVAPAVDEKELARLRRAEEKARARELKVLAKRQKEAERQAARDEARSSRTGLERGDDEPAPATAAAKAWSPPAEPKPAAAPPAAAPAQAETGPDLPAPPSTVTVKERRAPGRPAWDVRRAAVEPEVRKVPVQRVVTRVVRKPVEYDRAAIDAALRMHGKAPPRAP